MMTQKDIDETIAALRKTAEEALKSKEATLEFFRIAGIVLEKKPQKTEKSLKN
jgi:hypothetical protein